MTTFGATVMTTAHALHPSGLAMQRSLAMILLLASTTMNADTVIVPIRGDLVFGVDGSYLSDVLVTNIGSQPVTVRRGGVFPVFLQQPCSEPEPIVLQPLESNDILTGCLGLYAYTIESDGPIRVDAEITTIRPVRLPVGFTSTFHHQQIPTAREWLPASRDALMPGVEIAGEGMRTNLFVTNPNDFAITFELQIKRRSPLEPTRDEDHVVAPRSTALIRLAPIEDSSCVLPLVCGSAHRLVFTANGPYYASASAVDHLGDARFYTPSAVD